MQFIFGFMGALLFSLLPAVVFAAPSEMSERLPGNEESWIALLIVLGSLFSAWFLNHKVPAVRVMGTLLAASGCFAVVGWFVIYVLGSGFLENPKPYDAPFDAFKPTLLWIQSAIALLAGLGLLLVALRQSRDKQPLELGNRNEEARYGRVSRVLHWTIAILFIVMIPMGIFATVIPEGVPYRLEYYVVHKTIGVLIFALAIVRIIWNHLSLRPKPDASLKPIERKVSHGVHLMLYGLMLGLPVTGFIMTSYFGAPTYLFIWEMPPLWDMSEKGVLLWGLLHKYLLPYLVYVILSAHILGALKHKFFDKHVGIFKRMVS